MSELHQSPHLRKLIAEINAPFKPDLVLMDGIDAFVDGGPATGERVKGNVLLASQDRIAIDAVGIAALKTMGANDAIMNTPIFQQEQILRAVELGIGVEVRTIVRQHKHGCRYGQHKHQKANNKEMFIFSWIFHHFSPIFTKTLTLHFKN